MARSLNPDAILVLTAGMRLQWEKAQQAFVLLYPEGMIRLNESAGEVLKRVDGNRPVKAIVQELEGEFEDDNLADDVYELLEGALAQGWVQHVVTR